MDKLFLPAVLAFAAAAGLLVVRFIAFRILRAWAAKTETQADDIIIESFRTPSVFWSVALGIYIGVALSELPERYVFTITRLIHIIVILSVTVATANLSGRIFKSFIRQTNLPLPTTGLAYGLLAEPEPFVRFIPGFGDSSLNFTLICQVKEFTDQYLAQHELRKRIFKRFKEEGIEIPFPQRTVHLRREQEDTP